jgi:MFS family permease
VPLIQQEWGIANTQSGFIFSIYLIGYALSSLIFVPLTDKFSTRRMVLAGIIVLTTAHLLFALFARNIYTASLFRFLAGTGHALAYTPSIQMISRRFAAEKRGTAVGIFVGFGYAGTTLSYSFMGLLLRLTESWRTAYLWTAGISLLSLLIFLLIPQLPPQEQPTKSNRGRLDVTVLRDKPLAVMILAYALHTAELYLARLWLPLLLGATLMADGRSALEATATAATLSGFMFMMGIIGAFAGGIVSDRLGREKGAAFIFTISGLCSFIAGWLLGLPPIWLIVLGFVYGLMTAADSAIYITAVTELAPPDRVGSAQAIQPFLGFLVGAIVPTVAGSILDANHTATAWVWAFSFNGFLAVIAVASLLWLHHTSHTHS